MWRSGAFFLRPFDALERNGVRGYQRSKGWMEEVLGKHRLNHTMKSMWSASDYAGYSEIDAFLE